MMSKSDIREVQNKILEIMEYFDVFCKENGIIYYLMGGSALGAIRHHGFIPWDDDLDVFMTYENYIKFLNASKSKLDTKRFYFQEENTDELPALYSKIRMNGTTYIEEVTKNRNMHKGVFIDVFCLNNAPESKVLRVIQYYAARLLSTKALVKNGYITKSKKKKILLKLADIIVTDKRSTKLLKFVRSYNDKNTKLVGHYFGRAPFPCTTFPKKFLGKQRYVDFDGIMLPVPEYVEGYLSIRYGDNYMKMPDKKTRDKYPVHAVYADMNMDYKEYQI